MVFKIFDFTIRQRNKNMLCQFWYWFLYIVVIIFTLIIDQQVMFHFSYNIIVVFIIFMNLIIKVVYIQRSCQIAYDWVWVQKCLNDLLFIPHLSSLHFTLVSNKCENERRKAIVYGGIVIILIYFCIDHWFDIDLICWFRL